jgi:hypothetical protein
VFTVAETESFTRLWPDYWTEDEFGEFVAWLAAHPEAGPVIPGSGGCRKVRWKLAGAGKRSGVRIIHYNRLEDGTIWLLTIYAKNQRETIAPAILRTIQETIDG